MESIVKKDINVSEEVLAGNTDLFFTFQVPSRTKMKVTNFANYINEFDAWGLITWIMKRNGVPVFPYGDIQDQIAFGAPLRTMEGLEFQGGDTFEIYIKNEYIDVVKCGFALAYQLIEVQ